MVRAFDQNNTRTLGFEEFQRCVGVALHRHRGPGPMHCPEFALATPCVADTVQQCWVLGKHLKLPTLSAPHLFVVLMLVVVTTACPLMSHLH